MKIEIEDRLYNEFITWAKANNFSQKQIIEYINTALRNKLSMDKYGDLNSKLNTNHVMNENGKVTENIERAEYEENKTLIDENSEKTLDIKKKRIIKSR